MTPMLMRILDINRDEGILQHLSEKVCMPLWLLNRDGNVVAWGSGLAETDAAGAEHPPAPMPAGGSSVPLCFGGNEIATLFCPLEGAVAAAFLAAAAYGLENTFRLEAEINDLSSEIVRVYDELAFIYSLSSKLGSEMDLAAICRRVLDESCKALGAGSMALMLLEEGSSRLVVRAGIGLAEATPVGFGVDARTGVAGEAFGRMTATLIEEPAADSGLPVPYPSRSVLCIPLITDDRSIGMLVVGDKQDGGEFRSQEIKLLDSISGDVAASIKKAQLYERINLLFMHTVEALASSIDAKDPYTYGHSRRVADFAAIICGEMGMTKAETQLVRLASILHDIGKIGTPEMILQKPGRLLPEEIEKIKEHPIQGAQILSSIDELTEVIEGIRHHHERFDGEGYPDQMQAQQIPLQARIIAVADCFDAMTSNRPYRKSIDPDKAVIIMEDCAGSQFDPHVFAAFKKAFHSKAFEDVYQRNPVRSNPASDVKNQEPAGLRET